MNFVDEEKYKNLKGIYKITNQASGLEYIGQTKERFSRRFWLHRWQLRNNVHDNLWLQASFNKYGEDSFTFEVIRALTDDASIDRAEVEEIAKARERGHCCNIQDGGQVSSGPVLSSETRKKIGQINRQKNLGKKASEETKRKMAATRTGMRQSTSTINKMITTRTERIKNGEILATQKLTVPMVIEIKTALMNGENWKDIAAKYNISPSNINAIRSNRSWRYVHVDGWDEYLNSHKRSKKHIA